MASTGTRQLVETLADDVDAAFPAIVHTHVDGLYSGVLRLTHDRHEAEDIVQEALIRAHRALHGYTPERRRQLKLGGWLWTIAVNLCRNRARDVSRRPRGVSLDLVAERATTDDPASEAVDLADSTWDTRLSGLADSERYAVVLRHVVGLSYKEMEVALGRPAGTLKSDVHRGIERLRKIIETEGTSAA